MAFYRKQDEAEKLEAELQVAMAELHHQLVIREGADADLVACLQKVREFAKEVETMRIELTELKAAAEPVADMFEIRRPGAEIRPLATRLKETPSKVRAYLMTLRKTIPQQVLAYLKSFFPRANLAVVADGAAADCSDEKLEELMKEMEPVAASLADKISLK